MALILFPSSAGSTNFRSKDYYYVSKITPSNPLVNLYYSFLHCFYAIFTSYSNTTVGLFVRCSICSLRRSSSLRHFSHVLMWGSPSGPRMELRLLLLPVLRRNPTSMSWFWKAGSVSFSVVYTILTYKGISLLSYNKHGFLCNVDM